jgi:hypothetical protein
MKKQKALELLREMLPYLPEFRIGRNKLLAMKPIGFVLRGLLIEDSSDPNSFYFHQFYMPLCHQTDHVTLSYGNRIKTKTGNSGWDVNNPNLVLDLLEAIHSQALPILLKLNTVEDVIKSLKSSVGGAFYPLRDIGYLQVLTGDFSSAESTFSNFIKKYRDEVKRDWEISVFNEVQTVANRLQVNPKSAAEMIKNWQDETLEKLKLEKLR